MSTVKSPLRTLCKWFFILCAIIIALFVLLLIAGKTLQHSAQIHQLSLFLARYRIVAMVWRYAVMVLFIFCYPWLIHRLYRNADDTTKRDKLARRRYAVAFCLFYELIVVQNLVGLLLAKLMGAI